MTQRCNRLTDMSSCTLGHKTAVRKTTVRHSHQWCSGKAVLRVEDSLLKGTHVRTPESTYRHTPPALMAKPPPPYPCSKACLLAVTTMCCGLDEAVFCVCPANRRFLQIATK